MNKYFKELLSKLKKNYSYDYFKNIVKIFKNIENFTYPKKNKNGTAKTSEKQHYVPRVLLKQFSENNDGYVYLFDLKTNNFVHNEKISIDDIMKEKNFYVFNDKYGKKNFFFEKYIFSDFLEGNIDIVINKLHHKKNFTEKDWQVLSGFLAFQYIRTPAFINQLKGNREKFEKERRMNKSYEEIKKLCNKRKEKTGKSISCSIDELYEFAKSGDYDISVNTENIMVEAIRLGNEFWPSFLNAHYEILETRKKSFFILSDVPFFIIPPQSWPRSKGVGILYPPEAECLMPISTKQCIRVTIFPQKIKNGVSCTHKQVNNKEVNRINRYICKNSEQFIISKDKEYLKTVINQIDFEKVKKDKNRKTVIYNKNLDIFITHQFYPY